MLRFELVEVWDCALTSSLSFLRVLEGIIGNLLTWEISNYPRMLSKKRSPWRKNRMVLRSRNLPPPAMMIVVAHSSTFDSAGAGFPGPRKATQGDSKLPASLKYSSQSPASTRSICLIHRTADWPIIAAQFFTFTWTYFPRLSGRNPFMSNSDHLSIACSP